MGTIATMAVLSMPMLAPENSAFLREARDLDERLDRPRLRDGGDDDAHPTGFAKDGAAAALDTDPRVTTDPATRGKS